MSIRVMTAVWDSGAYEGGTLLVLLAFADWSKDDGTKVFPKLEQVMKKARLSERGVRDCIRRLEGDGTIILVVRADGTPGRANEWRIDLTRLSEIAALPRSEVKANRQKRNQDTGTNCRPSEEQPENEADDAPNTDQLVVAVEKSDMCAPMDSALTTENAQGVRGQFAAEDTAANDDADGGNVQHERGQTETATGAVCDTPPAPPYIEQPSSQPPYQPSSHPPSSGAREVEQVVALNKVIEPKPSDIPTFLIRDPFELFMRAGPWHPATNRSDAQKALAERPNAPPLAHITEAAKRYFAALDAKNARRRKDDPAHAVMAATFLRKAMWEDYPAPPPPVPRSTEKRHVWGMHPAATQLRAEIGDGEFDTWFAPCVLSVRDGIAILTAPSRLIRDRLASKHIDRLERALGSAVMIALEEVAA